MEIRKILWASDGSQESEDALKYAEILANEFGSQIIGFSVVQLIDVSKIDVPEEVRKELFVIASRMEEREYNRLEQAKRHLEQRGIKSEIEIETGVPHKEILKVAQEQDVDLIIMGKRGLGLKDRILLGSNTNRVLRETKLPVLAVRRSKKTVNIKKIQINLMRRFSLFIS